MKDIIPDKRNLLHLVELGMNGKVCLPNFQRDFVWSSGEIADLIRSILRGYYVGSLLLLRCDPNEPPFEPIALRGAQPTHTTLQPEYLVLDGQQRLTSLLYALYAPEVGLKNSKKPRKFYVDLNLLINEPDDDGLVIDRTETEAAKEKLNTTEGQWRQRKIPVTTLSTSKLFLEWRDGIDDWLRENDEVGHREFITELRPRWTEAITDFQTFQVPLIELPQVADSDHDGVSRICAIFEKLNSTGVDLSVYDLLTARLYRKNIKLHTLWEESIKEHDLLESWSDGKADTHKFGVLVLRTMALLRNLDPKAKILINLEPKNFEEDWRTAAAAIERALEIITHVSSDGFGVFEKKWMPNYGLLPVLAALRVKLEERKLGDDARENVRRWYWASLFLERYSSSVESMSRKDYAEMVRYWDDSQTLPSIFEEADAQIGAPGFTIRESASSASSVYCGVFALLAINNARDWRVGEVITLQDLEDHHIFPKSYLAKHGYSSITNKTVINSILNRTLISDDTNRMIRDNAPAAYVLDERIFSGPVESLINPHFVDYDALSEMKIAGHETENANVKTAFESFCNLRERAILIHIREACGVMT